MYVCNVDFGLGDSVSFLLDAFTVGSFLSNNALKRAELVQLTPTLMFYKNCDLTFML